MEYLLIWITTGVVAGVISKSLLPSQRLGGVFGDLLVGLTGAVAGGWLYSFFLGEKYGGWVGNTMGAVVGSGTLLFLLFLLRVKAAKPVVV